MVTTIKKQLVDVDIQYNGVGFGNDVTEEICKCRFTYGPMDNMAKPEQGVLMMGTAQEMWEMEEAEL